MGIAQGIHFFLSKGTYQQQLKFCFKILVGLHFNQVINCLQQLFLNVPRSRMRHELLSKYFTGNQAFHPFMNTTVQFLSSKFFHS